MKQSRGLLALCAVLEQKCTFVRDFGGDDETVATRRAIGSATRDAADLVGAAGRIVSAVTGRYADIVAVAGDPLKNPAVLVPVAFVMQGSAPTLAAR